MVDEKDQQERDPRKMTKEELERALERLLTENPRHHDLERQKIRLKGSDFEMVWGDADDIVRSLRRWQEDEPDKLAALVAIVKPRGANRLLDKVSSEAVKKLQRTGVLRRDGSASREWAAVLDAAYVEADGGVVLRQPIDYTEEFVKEWAPVDSKMQSVREEVKPEAEEYRRRIAEEAATGRRKGRGKGDGPCRG